MGFRHIEFIEPFRLWLVPNLLRRAGSLTILLDKSSTKAIRRVGFSSLDIVPPR